MNAITKIEIHQPISGVAFGISLCQKIGDEFALMEKTMLITEAEAWVAESPETRKAAVQPSGFQRPHFGELESLVRALRSRTWAVDDLRRCISYWPAWAMPAESSVPRTGWNYGAEPVALKLAELWAATRSL